MRIKYLLFRLGFNIYEFAKRMLNFRDLGAKIVLLDRKASHILLVQHSYRNQKMWFLPGGGIKRKETPLQAIKREVMEEVGISTQNVRLVGIYQGKAIENRLNFVFIGFAAYRKIKLQSEIKNAVFFKLDNLPKPLCPGVKERITEARTFLKSKQKESILWSTW